MTILDTTLPFLAEDCTAQFGPEAGSAILQQAETLYQRFLQETDDRGSPAIRTHLTQNLLPVLAYYKALRAQGLAQEPALAAVRSETRKAAAAQKAEMEQLGKLPFAYLLYRLGVKKHMAKHLPAQGWQTRWVTCNGKEIHFDLHRCLYWELTQAHGCPELCPVYCEKDEVAFSGLLPAIGFTRTGTLAEGAPCCDFHFQKARGRGGRP